MLTADSKAPSQTPRPARVRFASRIRFYRNGLTSETSRRASLETEALSFSLCCPPRGGCPGTRWVAVRRAGVRAVRGPVWVSPSASYRRCNGIRTVDACGGALKMPRTRSWVSGLLLLLPPPPAGSTTNVFLRETCLRRPRTQIRPPPSPQTARASLAASPMYDPGVSSSKRVLASSGISSVCTKARMPAASTRRPRVSSLSFS
jgi:hypothetical protein